MKKLRGFEYCNVILRDSLWKTQRDQTIETYLKIPDDNLLYGFRKKAGLSAPGHSLSGWYSDGAPSFGQMLGAFAKWYRQTDDGRIYKKLNYLISEYAKTMSPDGFGGYPVGMDCIYRFEKVLGGLLDAYEYAGIEQALKCAITYSDYMVAHILRDFPRNGIYINYTAIGQDVGEWYTLPENMYRLYRHCRKQEYYDLAKNMEYDKFWSYLENPEQNTYGPRHAYSHVNSLSSAIGAYLTCGDQRYLNIAEKGYDLIYHNHTYATGGYGPCEMLFGPDGYLGDFLKNIYDPSRNPEIEKDFFCSRETPNDSSEIPCCTWAVLKLGGYLIKETAEAKYAAWSERLLVNGMGGELPVKDNGDVMYYARYSLCGAFKTVKDNRLTTEFKNPYMNFRWQCCTGTYPQNTSEYANMIYYLGDNDDIYIAQYIPSCVTWEKEKEKVLLQMDTQYPFDGTISITITSKTKEEIAVHIRVPEWCAGTPQVCINGNDLSCEIDEDGWIVVKKVWSREDTIIVRYPMKLKFESVDEKNKEIRALCYGPLVLAGEEMMAIEGDCDNPDAWIKCIDEKQKIFETEPGHDMGYDFLVRRFRPYISWPEMEWYYMYNNVKCKK